jgi:hypothetical protein
LDIQLAHDLAALDVEDRVRHETATAWELDRDRARGAILGRQGIIDVQLDPAPRDAGERLSETVLA